MSAVIVLTCNENFLESCKPPKSAVSDTLLCGGLQWSCYLFALTWTARAFQMQLYKSVNRIEKLGELEVGD
ncbi:hypothetical protein RJT34_11888 [Clitoria ternatea]|uniref:Uncharacterized protein n=1 Tax=Clitoria ternatea TaxID=43366 RepID=A0AAN9JNF3_CLITE